MQAVRLLPTRCAICGTEGNADEIYQANFDLEAFNPAVFSARRLPDGIHYRMVRCSTCRLVRADPIGDPGALARLYSRSSFDYAVEAANLRRTYGRCLAGLSRYGARKGSLLEIGCGNGFFLEEALAQGYAAVKGVEPSSAAIEQAKPHIRPNIVCDVMRPALYEPHSFDVICLFQVLDHIPEPASVLSECLNMLRPGGLMLCINHNVESVSARLLRERSPIVDIEHTYLFSPETMNRLFTAHGFKVRWTGPILNKYSLYYLARLLPLPGILKRGILAVLEKTHIGSIRLSVPLGNLCIVAQKPSGQEAVLEGT